MVQTTFFRLIPFLQKAEISAEKKKITLLHGDLEDSKNKMRYMAISHKLKNIVGDYDPEDPYSTLVKIANVTKARTTLDYRHDDSDQED